MNPIQQTLEDYQALQPMLNTHLKGWPNNELKPAQIGIEEQLLDSKTLRVCLKGLNDAEGWLLCTGELVVVDANTSATLGNTLPLSGEWKMNGRHHRLVYLGANKWQLTTANIAWVDAAHAEALLERVVQEGTDASPGRLRYWRIWSLDEEQQLKPETALFDGFEGAKS